MLFTLHFGFLQRKRRRKVDKLGFRSQGLEVLWCLSACLYIVENRTAEFLLKGKQKLTRMQAYTESRLIQWVLFLGKRV